MSDQIPKPSVRPETLRSSRVYNPPMPTDLELLQGSWAIASLEMDGRKQAAPDEARIEIKGGRFTTLGMGPVFSGAIQLNEKSTPRHMDLHFDSGPQKGHVDHGIYEIQEECWLFCLAVGGGARPTEFATAPGAGIALETLKRAPNVTKSVPSNSEAAPSNFAAATAPATEIEGEWQMVMGVINGAAMDEATMAWVRRTNRGNISTVKAGPKTMLQVEFTLDAAQMPGNIDYVVLAGPHKGQTQAGIYSFDRGLLQICVAAPGGARAKEFASTNGDGRTFTAWKRA